MAFVRAEPAALQHRRHRPDFARLMMDVLGDRRFAAQGGDWGAFVTSRLA